jgi:hypothetical protein
LAKALPGSNSKADAGRKLGISRQAVHDAYEALKIKAPQRCEQLGISRDRVLQRFDEWAEGATKLVRVNAFEVKEVPDTTSRLRANENLRDIFGDGRGPNASDDSSKSGVRPAAATVCVVIADQRAAADFARLLAPGGSAGVVIDVGQALDENLG